MFDPRTTTVTERDEELGRWRWPENPDYVVYPDEDGDAVVLNERDGMSGIGQTRATVDRYPKSFGADAARAYFEAHPEKPWHEAKPGEVWALTTENVGDEIAARVAEVNEQTVFEYVAGLSKFAITDTRFTSGRRIWPEDAS
ncbi:hypothetical protein FGL91_00010 [Microbacterium sp. CBA3102]|uniref:hypothetical protein n=1 Tax=Microbacterium sp. CBA3102 TaxID=2603598 RepID=UPI0011BB82DA|nr:hypothetical protein [Microbacterium sp. CBA3102]QEA27072.1 hypothetical protein FGL91_00010 [Microbacterium sp. CBA3102]